MYQEHSRYLFLLTIILSFAFSYDTNVSNVYNSFGNQTTCNGHTLIENGNTIRVFCKSQKDCTVVCNTYPSCSHFTYHSKSNICQINLLNKEYKSKNSAIDRVNPRKRYNGTASNIVFLICESTDGRTYNQESPAHIPTIRKLQERGAYFTSFYSNSPVCAPSRSSLWSGRHVHRIPHINKGINVNGAWNNGEGNPRNYSMFIYQILANNSQQNYTIGPAFGKMDWFVGGHALWNWLQCWTMYVQFPYNITEGGWNEQPSSSPDPYSSCRNQGSIIPGNRTHVEDWISVVRNTNWIKKEGPTLDLPFFVYQGMNIVHPPYETTQSWYDKIAKDLPVPEWSPLSDLHPCDLQSSMLKGCIPNVTNAQEFYNMSRRQRIRRIYLAMIAEFDAMVAEYVEAVEVAGMTDKTIFIITSDHGDMNMEHQQFYKQVPYDASTRVPLVIAGPGIKHATHDQPASLVDIYPTILALAGVDIPSGHSGLDGYSLLPLLTGGQNIIDGTRPEWIISQGHMSDNAISWYLLRQNDYKYITYGTGNENAPQLFNIKMDPGEQNNLANNPTYKTKLIQMEEILRKAIPYADISNDVSDYSKKMFTQWYMKNYDWRNTLPKGIPGGLPGTWDYDLNGSLAAIQHWLKTPSQVLSCRNFTWKSMNRN